MDTGLRDRDDLTAPQNTGNEAYREALGRIRERKECPFCPGNLKKEHKSRILRKGTHWIATENQWPYKEANRHILLIARVHAENLRDLPTGAFDEALDLAESLAREFDMTSGALCMRFGDPKRNGGTVNHLHIHLLSAYDQALPGYKPIRFRVGAKHA